MDGYMKNVEKTPKKLEFRLGVDRDKSGQIGTNQLFWVVGRDVGFRSPNRDCPDENGTVGKYVIAVGQRKI